MANAITVDVDVPGLAGMARMFGNKKLADRIGAAWSKIYTSWTQQRFVLFSRGGGDWPGLSPSTLKKRRGKAGAAILRDTGLLFAALNGIAGKVFNVVWVADGQSKRVGLTATLTSSQSYRNGPSIGQVAKYHQDGGGRLPQRVILAQIEPNYQIVDTSLLQQFVNPFSESISAELTRVANDRSGYNASLQMRRAASVCLVQALVAGAKRGRNITSQ